MGQCKSKTGVLNDGDALDESGSVRTKRRGNNKRKWRKSKGYSLSASLESDLHHNNEDSAKGASKNGLVLVSYNITDKDDIHINSKNTESINLSRNDCENKTDFNYDNDTAFKKDDNEYIDNGDGLSCYSTPIKAAIGVGDDRIPSVNLTRSTSPNVNLVSDNIKDCASAADSFISLDKLEPDDDLVVPKAVESSPVLVIEKNEICVTSSKSGDSVCDSKICDTCSAESSVDYQKVDSDSDSAASASNNVPVHILPSVNSILQTGEALVPFLAAVNDDNKTDIIDSIQSSSKDSSTLLNPPNFEMNTDELEQNKNDICSNDKSSDENFALNSTSFNIDAVKMPDGQSSWNNNGTLEPPGEKAMVIEDIIGDGSDSTTTDDHKIIPRYTTVNQLRRIFLKLDSDNSTPPAVILHKDNSVGGESLSSVEQASPIPDNFKSLMGVGQPVITKKISPATVPADNIEPVSDSLPDDKLHINCIESKIANTNLENITEQIEIDATKNANELRYNCESNYGTEEEVAVPQDTCLDDLSAVSHREQARRRSDVVGLNEESEQKETNKSCKDEAEKAIFGDSGNYAKLCQEPLEDGFQEESNLIPDTKVNERENHSSWQAPSLPRSGSPLPETKDINTNLILSSKTFNAVDPREPFKKVTTAAPTKQNNGTNNHENKTLTLIETINAVVENQIVKSGVDEKESDLTISSEQIINNENETLSLIEESLSLSNSANVSKENDSTLDDISPISDYADLPELPVEEEWVSLTQEAERAAEGLPEDSHVWNVLLDHDQDDRDDDQTIKENSSSQEQLDSCSTLTSPTLSDSRGSWQQFAIAQSGYPSRLPPQGCSGSSGGSEVDDDDCYDSLEDLKRGAGVRRLPAVPVVTRSQTFASVPKWEGSGRRKLPQIPLSSAMTKSLSSSITSSSILNLGVNNRKALSVGRENKLYNHSRKSSEQEHDKSRSPESSLDSGCYSFETFGEETCVDSPSSLDRPLIPRRNASNFLWVGFESNNEEKPVVVRRPKNHDRLVRKSQNRHSAPPGSLDNHAPMSIPIARKNKRRYHDSNPSQFVRGSGNRHSSHSSI